MEQVRRRVIISGRVQGVFYRDSMATVAEREGVSGWVRNLPDRRVEAVLEGKASAVERVIEWSWQGPPSARVDQVEVSEEHFLGEYQGFDIVYIGQR
jgi:acylphosphatase